MKQPYQTKDFPLAAFLVSSGLALQAHDRSYGVSTFDLTPSDRSNSYIGLLVSDRDWVRYRAHFWDNGTITTVWQQPGDSSRRVHVITIDEFIRDTPNGPDSKPVFEEKMLGSEIAITGNLSVVWARYEAKFGSPDSLARWQGTDVFTLLRFGGSWKIVSLVFQGDS